MQTRLLLALAVTLLSSPLWAQEKPAPEEIQLKFNFRDVSLDAILRYVSSVTGWIFVEEKPCPGTITAVSDTDVPLSRCLDFLNSALRRHGLLILNASSPALPRRGQTLKVLDVKTGEHGIEIYVGSDPDLIPVTEQIRTQIIPLKAASAGEVQKELGELLRGSLGEGGQLAVSTYSNSLILTGRSQGIHRAVRILQAVDVSPSAELKIRVRPLANADATETARMLNEFFGKEAAKPEGRSPGLLFLNAARALRPPGVRTEGEGADPAGPPARTPAQEIIRIAAEPRTNSIILSATDRNLSIIEDLVARLDEKAAAALRLRYYPLRHADAVSVAKLVGELFAEPPSASSAPGRGGARGFGGPSLPGALPPGPNPEPQGAMKDVRALADGPTNTVVVVASEPRLLVVDSFIAAVDRPRADALEVKAYRLTNAEPVSLAALLQSLLRSGPAAVPGAPPARTVGPVSASDEFSASNNPEFEAIPDTRTRRLFVKASRRVFPLIDEVVGQLDQDATEAVGTYVVRLVNTDATAAAALLQNLLRGTPPGAPGAGGRPTPGSPPYTSMQPLPAASGNAPGALGPSPRTGASAPGRFGN